MKKAERQAQDEIDSICRRVDEGIAKVKKCLD